MAFGISTDSSGGNFTPIVKINSKAGRVYRVDREQGADGWVTSEVDITRDFQFVPDFDNAEVGWMKFVSGQAPDLRMVRLGEPMADRPEGVDKDGKPAYRQGLRMVLKLGRACGGDLRELAATAKSIIGPIDRLHDEFIAGRKAHPGQLPIVRMTDTKKVDIKTPHGTNTNYEPVFEIVDWVDREKAFSAAEPTEEKAAPAAAEAKAEPKREMANATEDF